jgi:hypothetical protein
LEQFAAWADEHPRGAGELLEVKPDTAQAFVPADALSQVPFLEVKTV